MKRRYHFLGIVLLLHLPLFAYPVLRLCHWLALPGWLTLAIFVPAFFSQVIARLYLRHANFGLVFWLRRGADLWLGISPIVLGLVLLAEIPVALELLAAPVAAATILVIAAALLAYSVVNAYAPSVVRVPITSDKLRTPVRIAQITDVHIGSRSGAFLDRVIDKVNSLQPDMLCVTGDLVDAPGIGTRELAAFDRCQAPVYFVIGNHERYEDLPAILHTLKSLGVNVLRSQSAVEGQVQLLGIDDNDYPGQVKKELARLAVDPHRFSLLLYHRPVGLTAAAAAGVDLMISGHTHNGQVVPFNLIVGRVFKRTVGMFSKGNTLLYVSPGTGTWGPVMRLGSRGEVTLFDVQPTTDAAPDGDADSAATGTNTP